MMMINIFRFLFLFLFGLVLVGSPTAQEIQSEPPRPQVMQQPQLFRMNPTQLLRLQSQLTFELQQTQRTLGFIDPNDQQLAQMLKGQQAELANQLKEINAQLKAQGIPLNGEESATAAALEPKPEQKPEPKLEPKVPFTPKADDPTLVPGGTPQPPVDPNLLIQQRPQPNAIPPVMPLGVWPSPIQPTPGALPNLPIPPTAFDQDQAWANSPWTPQPSKELTELKQTVDALRKEISELKENTKALETQIQLLNRNILLSQPAPK